MVHGDRQQQQVLVYRTLLESRFVLNNDPDLVQPLIGHLQNDLMRMNLCDDNGLFQVAISLGEALMNAIYHGNLELSSDLLQKDKDAYRALAEERRLHHPYRDRRVYVTAKLSRSEAIYIIRDEGPGFEPSSLGDPTDPDNLEKLSGRGLLLIRTFMDSVSHSEKGNEITMTLKKRNGGGE